MTYEVYRYIFICSAVLAALLFVLSILLFIRFKIPKVIGDVTGSTARKAVREIREQNAQSGDKTYKSSPVNSARGKVTDKIIQSGKLQKLSAVEGTIFPTEKISTKKLTGTDNTTVLTNGCIVDNSETTVLSMPQQFSENTFEIEHDITFIHTKEFIA